MDEIPRTTMRRDDFRGQAVPGHWCSIVPPYLLRQLSHDGDPVVRQRAETTLRRDDEARRVRGSVPQRAPVAGVAAEGRTVLRREVCDAKGTETLPGAVVRAEGAAATGDAAVDEAYDGFGAVWTYWRDVHGRYSIDDQGMALSGTVHFGTGYDNAFWDGSRMIFGDGDNEVFGRFTASLDVIAHELAHGVTEHTAALVYAGQSGALNEHVSDVFGVLAEQHARRVSAADADWLVGAELLLPGVKGSALRSMLRPGTAYDDPRLGKDPQPDHMDRFVATTSDNGGVHINSGIPNRAFATAAVAAGGWAWETVGPVWYDVLSGDRIQARCDFATFAALTVEAARARYGADHAVARAVVDGWAAVGVVPKEGAPADEATAPVPPAARPSLVLRRTGGFAGLVRERETTLDELPHPDADEWHQLLTGTTLRSRAARTSQPRPDAYSYEVVCQAYDVDVTLPEGELSPPERELFRRTLSD